MNQALDVTDALVASEKISEAASLMREDPNRTHSMLFLPFLFIKLCVRYTLAS